MTKNEIMDRLNKRSPFNKHNGVTVTDIGKGTSVVEAELNDHTSNPFGKAHGGLMFTMCDVAAGVAATGGISAGVTQSASMYYLRPGIGRSLRAEGKVLKAGRTVSNVETNVFDETGTLIARGEFEFFHTRDKLPDM